MRFWPLFGRKSSEQADKGFEERLTALEERWNTIEAEWTDWYEKFRLLHLRLAHRQKAAEKAEAESVSSPEGKTNGGEGSHESLPFNIGMGLNLDAHQLEMQRQVLKRRSRL
jgi:hypothetical protein